MHKNPLPVLCCLLLMSLASLAMPSGASAQQPIFYPPYELYRFHMGSTNGYFYTPWYSQGANAGYTFLGPIPSSGFGSVAVYPNPQNGYTRPPRLDSSLCTSGG